MLLWKQLGPIASLHLVGQSSSGGLTVPTGQPANHSVTGSERAGRGGTRTLKSCDPNPEGLKEQMNQRWCVLQTYTFISPH